MKRKVVRCVFAALSVIVMTIIFCLSSQNGDKSSELSGWWADAVRNAFNAMNMQSAADFVIEYIRKFAHVFLYACLGVCVSICAFTFEFKHKWLWLLIPVAICFVYACTDECHQMFVDGRDGKFTDVLIDAIGFVSATIISYTIWFFVYRSKFKKAV